MGSHDLKGRDLWDVKTWFMGKDMVYGKFMDTFPNILNLLKYFSSNGRIDTKRTWFMGKTVIHQLSPHFLGRDKNLQLHVFWVL